MFSIIFTVLTLCSISHAINPIILMPGLGGSQVFVEVNETQSDHFYCSSQITKMDLLWVNPEYLLPLSINCLIERMMLYYNKTTKTTSNKKGIVTATPGWGNTTYSEYLGDWKISRMEYFYAIVNEMVTNHGYKRGVNIRAAPFDFRKGPNELHIYQQNLTKLIEETYELNGQQKVILLAHSYGCPLTLLLLQQKTQSWKDKYIRSFVSLEGPYYGSVVTVKMMILGYTLNVPTVEGSWLRPLQQTWPSSYFLLPDQRRWTNKEVLVQAPTQNYTSESLYQLLEDLKDYDGEYHYNNTKMLLNPEIPPGVETFCIIGNGVPTDAWMDCSKATGWPYSVDECVAKFGDGDGTVPWRSLNMCSNWNGRQPNPFHLKVLPKAEHFSVLSDPRFLDYVSKEVVGKA